MSDVHYPTHPAMEKAICECAAAAADMQALEWRIETRGVYSEKWAQKVTARWEAALQALTVSARAAGKNTQKRSPSGSSLLYSQVD